MSVYGEFYVIFFQIHLRLKIIACLMVSTLLLDIKKLSAQAS